MTVLVYDCVKMSTKLAAAQINKVMFEMFNAVVHRRSAIHPNPTRPNVLAAPMYDRRRAAFDAVTP